MIYQVTLAPATGRRDKKLIMVSSDLADQLLQLASREGKPLSTFVQEHLEHVVSVHHKGYKLGDAVKFYEIASGLKSSGAVFIPLDVMKFILEALPLDQREKLQLKWYDAGAWYGKYLLTKFSDQVEALESLLKASWWDLDEVNVTRKAERIEFRCISMGSSLEETEFLRSFIEGAMHTLGYKTAKEDRTRGIVLLVFQQYSSLRDQTSSNLSGKPVNP